MSPIGGTVNLGITVIRSRHSVRKYKDSPVGEKTIRDASDCARLAPTARNEQPWLFGVIQNRETLQAIADLARTPGSSPMRPVCFAVFGKKDAKYYLEDCCAANNPDHPRAPGMGGRVLLGRRGEERLRRGRQEAPRCPEEYTLVSLVPAGYPEEIDIAKKKILDDVSFFERYEEED